MPEERDTSEEIIREGVGEPLLGPRQGEFIDAIINRLGCLSDEEVPTIGKYDFFTILAIAHQLNLQGMFNIMFSFMNKEQDRTVSDTDSGTLSSGDERLVSPDD